MTESGPVLFAWHQSMGVTYISALARRLRERHGIRTVFFTSNRNALRDSERLFGFDESAFEEVVDITPLLAPARRASLADIAKLAARAASAEAGLVHSINDILRTDRHIGLGFVPEVRFMRSRFTLAFDYDQSIDLIVRLLDAYRGYIRHYRPIGAIVAPGCVRTASLTALLEAAGTPVRNLVCSRLGHAAHWTTDWYGTPYQLRERYDEALLEIRRSDRAWLAQRVSAAIPRPFNAQIWFDVGERERTFSYLFQRGYSTLRIALAHRVRRRKPQAYGEYLTSERLWLIMNRWLARRRDARQSAVMPTLPANTPYVFFPLPLEPEATLQTEAQEWNNLLAFVDFVAKALPAGWRLVVKEHPMATAPRARGFWRRVRSYPNVVVPAAREVGEPILANARAIAVVNGTLGIQAAVAGMPVVTPHRHYLAHFLPHVLVADSPSALRSAFERVRDGALPSLEERLIAGRAFELALASVDFTVKSDALLSDMVAKEAQSAEDVEVLADTLVASLQREGAPLRAVAHVG